MSTLSFCGKQRKFNKNLHIFDQSDSKNDPKKLFCHMRTSEYALPINMSNKERWVA